MVGHENNERIKVDPHERCNKFRTQSHSIHHSGGYRATVGLQGYGAYGLTTLRKQGSGVSAIML